MTDIIGLLSNGLSVQRLRANVLAANLANAQTTRTAEGGPYKRKDVVISAVDVGRKERAANFDTVLDQMSLSSPKVVAVLEDQSEPRKVHQPGHPDADKDGYVSYPNINMVGTMTDMMSATRAYEAQVSALKTVRRMLEEASRIAQQY